MAVLETLRTKFGLAITILVALGLLSFIIDPSSLETAYQSMSSKYDVGEIDGKSISYNDFQTEVDQLKTISEMMSGSSATVEQQEQLRNLAWQNMIDKYLFIKSAKSAGINVGSDEMLALVSGDMISPVLTQNMIFADENGLFSKERLHQFVQATASDPNLKLIWDNMQNSVYTQQFYSKYASIFNEGNYKSSLMLKKMIEENNNTVDVDFVMVPINPYVQDTTITVSSEEIKAYYKNHLNFFRQQENRDIEYVVFEVKPSDADIAATTDVFNGLYNEFGTTDNLKSFLSKNSDRVLSNYWYKAGELATINQDINDFIFSDGNGVSPIVRNGNTFYAAKVVEKAMLPDSAYVKHILLQGEGAEQRADSLLSVVSKKGSDFAAVASLYSNDTGSAADGVQGNIGWMTQSYMIPGFESVLSHKTGEPFILKTQYGWHIVEVERVTKPIEKVQVAILEKTTLSSKETFNSYYSTANEFATRAADGYQAYKAAVDTMKVYSHVMNNVLETNSNYGSIADAREVTRWIFDNKKGKVSGIITVNNNFFFVATIKDVHKEGTATLAEAAQSIRQQLLMEKTATKNAEEVASKISGLTDLQSIADALNTSVNTQSGITFASLTSQGLDPKFIGAVSVAPIGEVSKPLAGTIATYVYQVKAREAGSFFTEDDARNYDESISGYMQQMILPVMSEAAGVVDHRAKFY